MSLGDRATVLGRAVPAVRGERLAAVREWLEVGLPPRCYFILPCCEGASWPPGPGPTWDEERRRRTQGSRLQGAKWGANDGRHHAMPSHCQPS